MSRRRLVSSETTCSRRSTIRQSRTGSERSRCAIRPGIRFALHRDRRRAVLGVDRFDQIERWLGTGVLIHSCATKLEAIQANIVTLEVDAIVNAANTTLLAAAVSTGRSIAARPELLASAARSAAVDGAGKDHARLAGCRRNT